MLPSLTPVSAMESETEHNAPSQSTPKDGIHQTYAFTHQGLSSHILQAECLAAIQTYPKDSVHTAFLDPPYNTGLVESKVPRYTQNKDFAEKKWDNFHAEWDTIPDYYRWSAEWLDALRPRMQKRSSVWICCTHHCQGELLLALKRTGYYIITQVAWCIPNAFPHLAGTRMAHSHQTLIWARPYASHFYNYPVAKSYNDGKNLRDYWLINNDTQAGKRWKHPSKKPPALVRRALHISTPEQGHVVDFFAGSGTTGLACEQLTRDYTYPLTYTLSDQNAEYAAMAHERIKEYLG